MPTGGRSGGWLQADGSKQFEDGFAHNGCCYPDEWLFRVDRSVQREDEAVGGEEERERCAQRVARVVVDVEADGELAMHRALKAHPEKQAPLGAVAARREERPAAGRLYGWIVFDDSREVENVTSSA